MTSDCNNYILGQVKFLSGGIVRRSLQSWLNQNITKLSQASSNLTEPIQTFQSFLNLSNPSLLAFATDPLISSILRQLTMAKYFIKTYQEQEILPIQTFFGVFILNSIGWNRWLECVAPPTFFPNAHNIG